MLATLALILLAQQTPQDTPVRAAGEGTPPGLLRTGDNFYKPLTEYAVCNGLVTLATVIPNGSREIMFVHQDLDDSGFDAKKDDRGLKLGPPSIRIFNPVTKNTRILRGFGQAARVFSIELGKGGCPGIVIVESPERDWLFFYDMESSRLTQANIDSNVIGLNPYFLTDSKLTALILEVRGDTTTVGLFDRYGTMVKERKVPKKVALYMGDTVGDVVIYAERIDGKLVRRAYNLVEEKEVPVPARASQTSRFPILLDYTPANGQIEWGFSGPKTFSAVGRGSKDEAGDGGSVALATGLWEAVPDEDGTYVCLYGPAGMRIVPFKKLTDAEVEVIREEWVKMDAMTRGKMVGTALQIYAADHGNHFPKAGNWHEDLMPYIKNASLMRDFTYTLNGQNGADLDVSKDTCGFIETAYGRAVVMADSSVRWIPRGR